MSKFGEFTSTHSLDIKPSLRNESFGAERDSLRNIQAAAAADNEIESIVSNQAKAGFLTVDEIKNLTKKRYLAAEILLKNTSRILPYRFSIALQAAIQKSEILQIAYIDSLDSKEDKYKLAEIAQLYQAQIEETLLHLPPTLDDEQIKTLKSQIAKLIKVSYKADIYGLTAIWQKLDNFRTELPDTQVKSQKIAAEIARLLIQEHFANLDNNSQMEWFFSYVKTKDIDLSPQVTILPIEKQKKLVMNLCAYLHRVNPLDYPTSLLPLIKLLEPIDQAKAIETIFQRQIRSGSYYTESLAVIINIRRFLDVVDTDSEQRILTMIAQANSKELFSSLSGELQLQQITTLTTNPTIRTSLFWSISLGTLIYPKISDLNFDQLIIDCPKPEYSDYQKRIDQWFESNQIDIKVRKQFGRKIIEAELTQDDAQIVNFYKIKHFAEKYQVDLSYFKPILIGKIKSGISDGSNDTDLLSLARLIDGILIESEWKDFDLDLQATADFGKTTWRKVQSLIDILQNHLDAEDFRYAQLLARRVKPSEAMAYYELNPLWYFKKRWPFTATNTHYASRNVLPTDFRDNPAQLAEKLDGLPPPEKPRIELLILINDQEIWIDRQEITNQASGARIIGVRITDSGLGYDKELGTMFAPTKQGIDFMRGRFGQGAKMSIIALLREGCQVELGSRALISETGEMSEWHGESYYSDKTSTIKFRGKQRKIFDTTGEHASGSTTTIRFNKADQELQELLKTVLDLRQGQDNLGTYVLDYNPLANTYFYGGLNTNITISLSKDMRQKIFVHGLQVPNHEVTTFCFSYNLDTTDVLTGRDRRYLDDILLKNEVIKVWQGVTDDVAVTELYTYLLGKSNEHIWGFELDFMPRDMVRGLSQEAKLVHERVIRKILEYPEGTQTPIVLISSQQMTKNPEVKQKLEAAGYKYIISYPYSNGLENLVQEVMGDEKVVYFQKIWKEINNIKDGESLSPSDPLRNQMENLVVESRESMCEFLIKNGQAELATLLGNQPITISYLYSNNSPKLLTVRNRFEYPKDGGDRIDLGRILEFYPQFFTGDESIPEQLTAFQLARLRFELDSDLLLLAAKYLSQREELSGYDNYRVGQELANRLLAHSSHQATQAYGKAGLITISEGSGIPQLSNRDTMLRDIQIVKVRDKLQNLFTTSLTRAEAEIFIKEVHILVVAYPDVFDWVMTSLEVRKFTGLTIFDSGDLWELKTSTKPEPGRFLELSPQQLKHVGNIDNYQAYQLGIGKKARIAIPLDFSNTEVVVIRVQGKEVPISRYARRKEYFKYSNDIGSGKFFNPFAENSACYFSTDVHVENGMLVFPIGSESDAVVAERVDYFIEKLDLHLYIPGTSEEIEDKEGEPLISTNASTEYGSGKVWDDPIRIFGDIWQNHSDGGHASITFHVAKLDGLVDENRLRQTDLKDATIIGIVIQDDGEGYTTQGLRKWGQSTKRSGGKKGRFGEGLKMLSVACARHSVGLTFSSRKWKGRVTTDIKNFTANGVVTKHSLVAFDMTWNDASRDGSATEISLENTSPNSVNLWNKWLDVLDPRQPADESGYQGLSRYVRELRVVAPKEEEEIVLGRVSILPNEPGKVFERGLIVPGAIERAKINLLFGYDIDDEIISTQERNVIDPSVVRTALLEAYRHAPYGLCLKIMLELRNLLNSPSSNEEKNKYIEFSLLSNVENIEVLRLAYFTVFGPDTPLSSKDEAKNTLGFGSIYDEQEGKSRPLTLREQALLEGIITFEENYYPEDSVVNLYKDYPTLHNKLKGHVRTTSTIFEKLFDNPIELGAAQIKNVKVLTETVAADMLNTFQKLMNSETGQEILKSLMSSSERTPVSLPKLNFEGNDIEYALKFLTAVAAGLLPLNINVLPSLVDVHGFVSGQRSLTYSAATLKKPEDAVATTMHELLHLAFRTHDHNSTFYNLLLLCQHEFADRHTQKSITG